MSETAEAAAPVKTFTTTTSAQDSERGKLTPEYVAELRSENKDRRTEAAKLAEELQETKKQLEETRNTAKQALDYVDVATRKATDIAIRAEMKVLASKYGLKDMDYLQLMDKTGVKVDENGDVIGAEEVFQTYKEKKPDFFASVTTSRSDGGSPQAASGPARETKYDNMSLAELMNASLEQQKTLK